MTKDDYERRALVKHGGDVIGRIENEVKSIDSASVASAVYTLTAALKEDAGLWITYKANIAMAFVDVMDEPLETRESYKCLYAKANDAAERFLCSWTGKRPEPAPKHDK